MDKCRFCGSELKTQFIDLGMSPLANSYVLKKNLQKAEMFFPLNVKVCNECFLAQLPVLEKPESIFVDYDYFSSYSTKWLEHSQKYVEMITEKLSLNQDSLVIEAASNDGYLLQYFLEKRINVLGVEPAANVAKVAIEKGVDTLITFFGEQEVENVINIKGKADLVVANNVLAHVPDINSFVLGIKGIMKETGSCTIEFPNLLNLITYNQFDTIYHEHFSYLSFTTAKRILESHGLKVYNVDNIHTHGGSVRIYACHKENLFIQIEKNVDEQLALEEKLLDINTYSDFREKVRETKRNILEELITLKKDGKQIIGYGAAAKGNTLLNYCGIGRDFIEYVVDLNPHKQGKFLPGTHIPIYDENKIKETKPDYIVILPWNIQDEIMEQLEFVREWNAKFITFIPSVKII